MAVTIWYETHGVSTDNEAGRATGWLPGELSESGRSLVCTMGARSVERGIETAFVSDLNRAVETARLGLVGTGIPVVYDERLRECNYGDLNGGPVELIARQRMQRITIPYPHGESFQDVTDRTSAFLRDLSANYGGKTVLIIAHSANRWALSALLERTSLEEQVDAPFNWQPGWRFLLPDHWNGLESSVC